MKRKEFFFCYLFLSPRPFLSSLARAPFLIRILFFFFRLPFFKFSSFAQALFGSFDLSDEKEKEKVFMCVARCFCFSRSLRLVWFLLVERKDKGSLAESLDDDGGEWGLVSSRRMNGLMCLKVRGGMVWCKFFLC